MPVRSGIAPGPWHNRPLLQQSGQEEGPEPVSAVARSTEQDARRCGYHRDADYLPHCRLPRKPLDQSAERLELKSAFQSWICAPDIGSATGRRRPRRPQNAAQREGRAL